MGLYYNPPSPFIGGRQPLAPGKIVPPSGPTPSNPPPAAKGFGFPFAVYAAWAVPIIVFLPGPFVPAPEVDAPPIQAPLSFGAIFDAWYAPVAPVRQRTLPVPQSGPAIVANPPPLSFDAVLRAWYAPPVPVRQRVLPAPASGPTPSNPPRLKSFDAIYRAWNAPPDPVRQRVLPAPPSGPTPPVVTGLPHNRRFIADVGAMMVH